MAVRQRGECSVNQVLAMIDCLRTAAPNMEHLFRNGACYELFLMIRAIRQDAEPWYCWPEGHVYTRVGQTFVDIRGRVRLPAETFPMDASALRRAHRWKHNAFGRR